MNAIHEPAVASGKKGRRLNPRVLSDPQIAFNEFVDANIFGQAEGRRLIKQAYTNFLNPLRNKLKPIAFIMLAGESRSGKTETARLIPRFVHNHPEAFIKINCSEFIDKYHLSNLIGSPRGYIGNEIVGTEKYASGPKDKKQGFAEFTNHNLEVSKKGSTAPVTVVLLDEWEKACYEFNLLMLQIMDDGLLTLGSGEVVDFRNTIFIATTNIGMREVENEEKGGIGFNATKKKLDRTAVSTVVMEEIRKRTPPEFRNRLKELGGVAIYERLSDEQMRLVLDRDLAALQAEIHNNGLAFSIGLSDRAKDEVMRRALANDGNLSNLKSVISTEICAALGTEAIKGSIRAGELVFVDVEPDTEAAEEGALMFSFEAQDYMGGTLFGIGMQEAAARSVGAGQADAAPSPEDELEAALYQVGSLLGVRNSRLMLVALGRQPGAEANTGFLLGDQLTSLGLMPKTPGIFTDIHNMTMLTNAAAIKSNTERFPELMRSFSIEFKNDKSGIILSSQAAELVHEVTELLGMEVLESKVAHARPYTFSMKVRALPQAVVFCGLRFSRLGLTVKELPEAK